MTLRNMVLIAVIGLAVAIGGLFMSNNIREIIRESRHGGILIDIRQSPPIILYNKQVPSGQIIVITGDGERKTYEAKDNVLLEKFLTSMFGGSFSPDPSTQPATAVDRALAHLKSANVAFNAPDHARVGKAFIVEAKISTYLGKLATKALIDEPGNVDVSAIKVSDRVTATLVGGSSFDVSPVGPQEQWVSDAEPTGWAWHVTPKVVGDGQVLFLNIDAIFSIDNKDDKRTINTFKKHINVDVGWPETVGEWLDLIKKTGENVSWIWASLLIPVVGGIWAWLKRRRQAAKSEATPQLSTSHLAQD
jgi:hypothetical protein